LEILAALVYARFPAVSFSYMLYPSAVTVVQAGRNWVESDWTTGAQIEISEVGD
jgi:hypothetical protein